MLIFTRCFNIFFINWAPYLKHKKMEMNILLVDDHIMTLEGYSSILNESNNTIHKAQNCQDVYNVLTKDLVFDVAIIDHNLPAYSEKKLHSGVDCALLIKKANPNCKIILITAHTEFIELYSMYKKVNPSALIVKENLTVEIFRSIVYSSDRSTYFCDHVKQAIKFVTDKLPLLNETNTEILMYLSKGFKINELTDIIGLSKSAIQKRIAKMQLEFDVSDSSSLIKVMYELNYV